MVEQELLFKQKLPIKVLSGGPEILQKLLLLILLAPAPDFLLLMLLRWNTGRREGRERGSLFSMVTEWNRERMSMNSFPEFISLSGPADCDGEGGRRRVLKGDQAG